MRMEIGNMQLEIRKTQYNKTIVQPDGITHITDTEHDYYAYQFGMAKNYFDINNKDELLDSLIGDLRTVISELEKQKDKLKDERQDEERE